MSNQKIYQIKLATKRVGKQIARIPRVYQDRIIEKIRSLKENPRPAGAAQINHGVYRVRIGNYRVIYKVFDDENLVLIGKVARKSKRTYKDIETLFKKPKDNTKKQGRLGQDAPTT